MTTDARQWLEQYAAALGCRPPSEEEVTALLDLAAVAAHASERPAAPLSCWLAAACGRPVGEALALARQLAGQLGEAPGAD